jgi:hypothetical protein
VPVEQLGPVLLLSIGGRPGRMAADGTGAAGGATDGDGAAGTTGGVAAGGAGMPGAESGGGGWIADACRIGDCATGGGGAVCTLDGGGGSSSGSVSLSPDQSTVLAVG